MLSCLRMLRMMNFGTSLYFGMMIGRNKSFLQYTRWLLVWRSNVHPTDLTNFSRVRYSAGTNRAISELNDGRAQRLEGFLVLQPRAAPTDCHETIAIITTLKPHRAYRALSRSQRKASGLH